MVGGLDDRTDHYPKLSRSFESMKPEYDVVVVGSGYGAGVAASRMARAGKSVAILELGWELRPGSYPHTPLQCLKQMHISGSFDKHRTLERWFPTGDITQLFQLVLGNGQHAFSAHGRFALSPRQLGLVSQHGAGLGGGSLINAGVFLEADERSLQMSPWPAEIKKNPSTLRPYYRRAAAMLQPSTYPEEFPRLKKSELLREQSMLLKQEHNFYRVPLTTSFRNTRNSVGVAMRANRGSGHECTGLNDGSKNTVATTYLADAWNWGAEIFCGCEVRFLEQHPGNLGYVIHFSWHGSGRSEFKDDFKNQLFWVRAKEFCFLGAGALGTTEVLLRSRQRGMQMSPALGRNLSGNGDLLLFAYNTSSDVNAIAREHPDARNRPGPTVTSIIDNRVAFHNPLDGYVIEDGCIPEPFNPIIQSMLISQAFRNMALSLTWSSRPHLRKILASLKSLLMGPYAKGGAVQRTATYLIMSHDSTETTLTLKGDKLVLTAPSEGRSERLATIRTTFSKILASSGAKMGFSYFNRRHQEEVTVHLLGGANMSRNGLGHEGVTNHIGQVFRGHGDEVYQGLVCCDASVIPTSLGVNPLATISALAERSLVLLAENSGFSIDMDTRNGDLDADSQPMVSGPHQACPKHVKDREESAESIGWQFTEVLNGNFCVNTKIKDFVVSENTGKGSSCAMQMYLTIKICRSRWSRNKTSRSPYQGKCTGTVSCYALSKTTLKVIDGDIEFFAQGQENPESKVMRYNLELQTVEGTQYHLQGHKLIDSRISFSPSKTWAAVTILNVIVFQKGGSKVGAGRLRISWQNFRSQLRTFRLTEDFSVDFLWALWAFLVFFVYQVSLFLSLPFAPAQRPRPSTRVVTASWEKLPHFYTVTACDEVRTRLEVYDPLPRPANGYKSSKIKAPPMLFLPGVTGVGADYTIYGLPFLRRNMIDYFTALGHRCYLLTPRWGCETAVAENCTVYDCRQDIAAALNYICNRELEKPYVMAHCQGSVALAMGLLDGTISGSQILGVTANSVFMNEVFAYWNSLKGRTTLLIQLYEILAGNFFPIDTSARGDKFQWVLDILLRFYPVSDRRELCTSTACHRTSFGFGLLWNHANLDLETHQNIHRFFTGTPTKLLKHVVRGGTHGSCLNNELQPLMTPGNLERLRGVPILFVSGTENQVFDPESTLKDYELLRRRFGEEYYRRFLVDGYGHLDPIIGKNATEDVFWKVHEHVKWCFMRTELPHG